MLVGEGILEAHTHYQSATVQGWASDHTLHLAVSFPLICESSKSIL